MEGFRAQAEQAAAHGGQVDGQRVVPAVDAAVGGVECFRAGLVRAAPDGGLGVQQFFGPTGKLEVERELFVGGVLGVHHTEQVLSGSLAQPGVHTLGTAYTLTVNDTEVAEVEDSSTPAEFALTPYIREGKNAVVLTLRRSAADALNAAPASRKAFENSYLYTQNKRSIRDFEIALVPDSTRKFGVLELAIVAQNAFNYDEPVTVGYDIYSPQGKLLDFNIREVVIPGRMTDTVRFTPFIYGTNANKWEPGAKNPPLYKVMLFTRRDGAYREYMPLKIGFGKTEFTDGRITRFDKEIKLVKTRYNAAADRKTTLAELKTLKSKGSNTVCPDYPQPAWFYELCDELGLYVIDRANINAPDRRDDRRVGGTPSNDPALADEYLERVKAMYYRSRNHTCVVAFALGGESGNGYNMYKAYEWLKSVEKSRPVIYTDADGEWNSDL